MHNRLPTVDFMDVSKVVDLPVTWMSTPNEIQGVRNYILKCESMLQEPSPEKIAELTNGYRVHLRQTTLGNGLRFVTIHKEDGTEVYRSTDISDILQGRSEPKKQPHPIEETDLGDGFKLNYIDADPDGEYERTISRVEKEFSVGSSNFSTHYSIQPATKHLQTGNLNFFYEVDTRVPYIDHTETDPDQEMHRSETKKYVIVEISNYAKFDGKLNPQCDAKITVGYSQDVSEKPHADQVIIHFFSDGRIYEIIGVSHGSAINPDWASEDIEDAILKGQGVSFKYAAHTSQAELLTRKVLGIDIATAKLDIKETLNSLIQATIKESDIDVIKTLRYQ